MKLVCRALAPLLVLGASACDSAAGPRQCVAGFYGAMRAGDAQAARSLLIASERRDAAMSFDARALTSHRVRGCTIQGERAVVTVEHEGMQRPMRYVVLLENGEWRISMNATIRASFGSDMDETDEAAPTKPAAPPLGR